MSDLVESAVPRDSDQGFEALRFAESARPVLTWQRAAALFLILSTLFHIGLIFRYPLAPDETYYWQWGRHLDWGYYDQGPMVGWLIRATCTLFGDTPFGVRIGIVAAALATQIFLYLLARDLFGPRIALISLLPTTLTPLAGAGGFLATYDPLAVLFWAMAIYFAARALFFESRSAWIGVGIAGGLGLLSKHTVALLAPCLLLYLVTVPAARVWLRRPGPWLALAVALLVFSPNLWWQANHDWLTFHHLFALTGKGVDQAFLRRFGDYVGSQAGLMTPLLFLLLVGTLIWAGRLGPKPGRERLWFLFCLSGPVLGLFLAMTLRSKVQANWAATGWLAPPIIAAVWLDEAGRIRRWPWRFAAVSMAFCCFLTLALVWPEGRAAIGLNVPVRWDQMNKLYGGAEAAAAADAAKAEMASEGVGSVGAGAMTYDLASWLAFYMKGQPDTRCLFAATRINSYVLWNSGTLPKPGGSMVIVDDFGPDNPRLAPFARLFDRVVPIPEPVPVYRVGTFREPVRVFHVYKCYGYRPNEVVETPVGG